MGLEGPCAEKELEGESNALLKKSSDCQVMKDKGGGKDFWGGGTEKKTSAGP